MAMVQYQVMYRYIHPVTKKVSTNTVTDKYGLNERFVKGYTAAGTSATGTTMSNDTIDQQSPSNAKYDMLFVYDGVLDVKSFITDATITGSVLVEKFQRCRGEGFFIASTHSSLTSAINAADPLVKSIGKDNVKVVKVVPLDITVGLE